MLDIGGESLGINWTHIGAAGWYVDAIAMGTWLHGDGGSSRGIGVDISGLAGLASIEAGYPIAVGSHWTIEPQAQLIWQSVNLDDTSDPFSTIDYDRLDSFTGRIGARLEGTHEFGDQPLHYFLSIDLWHDSETDNDVIFNDRAVTTEFGGTFLEARAGASGHVTDRLSLYGSLGYTAGLTDDGHAFGGNLGLRYRW